MLEQAKAYWKTAANAKRPVDLIVAHDVDVDEGEFTRQQQHGFLS